MDYGPFCQKCPSFHAPLNQQNQLKVANYEAGPNWQGLWKCVRAGWNGLLKDWGSREGRDLCWCLELSKHNKSQVGKWVIILKWSPNSTPASQLLAFQDGVLEEVETHLVQSQCQHPPHCEIGSSSWSRTTASPSPPQCCPRSGSPKRNKYLRL